MASLAARTAAPAIRDAPAPGAAPPLFALEPELSCIRAGLKPAGRHSLSAASAAPLISALQALGLCASLYWPEDPAAGIGYLSPAEQALLLASPRGHLLYARDPDQLAALVEAHEAGDNEAIGALLGYPPCCVAANRLWDALPFNDYVRLARTSAAFDWRLNIFTGGLRDRQGRSLQTISHFPCTLACADSIVLADLQRAALRERSPDFAAAIVAAARLPVLLHDDTGLAPDRRTGLCGWLLRGLAVGDSLVFDGIRPLREQAVPPLALPDRGRFVRDGDGWAVEDEASGTSSRLDGERWLLLLPS
jgi:hypothetical protein